MSLPEFDPAAAPDRSPTDAFDRKVCPSPQQRRSRILISSSLVGSFLTLTILASVSIRSAPAPARADQDIRPLPSPDLSVADSAPAASAQTPNLPPSAESELRANLATQRDALLIRLMLLRADHLRTLSRSQTTLEHIAAQADSLYSDQYADAALRAQFERRSEDMKDADSQWLAREAELMQQIEDLDAQIADLDRAAADPLNLSDTPEPQAASESR